VRSACTCRGRIPRCDVCFGLAKRARASAACRAGYEWALRVAKATYRGVWPPPEPWPTQRARARALSLAEDISRDPRIRDHLAVEINMAAKRVWDGWLAARDFEGKRRVVAAPSRLVPPWLDWNPARYERDPEGYMREIRAWRLPPGDATAGGRGR
jgi:hypothetical protein